MMRDVFRILSERLGSEVWHRTDIPVWKKTLCLLWRARGSARRQERIWSSDLSSPERENALCSEHTKVLPHLQSFIPVCAQLVCDGRDSRYSNSLTFFLIVLQAGIFFFSLAPKQTCFVSFDRLFLDMRRMLRLPQHFIPDLTRGPSAPRLQRTQSGLAGVQEEINKRPSPATNSLLYYHIQQLGHSRTLVSSLVCWGDAFICIKKKKKEKNTLMQTSWSPFSLCSNGVVLDVSAASRDFLVPLCRF